MDSTGQERGLDQPGTASAQAEPVISVRGLVKRYGSQEAVAGIDLDVRHGEIFAFLGPNGAGKTTTVEMLEGFRQRTGGEISVLGHDPATAGGAWRDRVGIVLQVQGQAQAVSLPGVRRGGPGRLSRTQPTGNTNARPTRYSCQPTVILPAG